MKKILSVLMTVVMTVSLFAVAAPVNTAQNVSALNSVATAASLSTINNGVDFLTESTISGTSGVTWDMIDGELVVDFEAAGDEIWLTPDIGANLNDFPYWELIMTSNKKYDIYLYEPNNREWILATGDFAYSFANGYGAWYEYLNPGSENVKIDITLAYTWDGSTLPSNAIVTMIVFIAKEANATMTISKCALTNGTTTTTKPTASNTQYTVRAIDSVTQQPIANSSIQIEGDYFQTDHNGVATIKVENTSSYRNAELVVSANGYQDATYHLTDWKPNACNILELTPDIGLEITGADLGKTTVSGPTIDFLGESFPLFTLDIGFDLSGIPGLEDLENIKKANNIMVDYDTKTIKVMLGIGDGYQASNGEKWNEDYKSFKEYYKTYHKGASNQEALNKYNKIRNKLSKYGTNMIFDCYGTICGYVEIDYSTGQYRFKEGGLVVTLEAGVRQDVPIGTIGYMTFRLAGEVATKAGFQLTEIGDLTYVMGVSAAFKPSVGIGAKVISKKVASVEGGIEGEFRGTVEIPADSLAEALTLTMKANLYLRANIFFLEGKISTDFPGVELYPNFGATPALLSLDENSWEPISREYLENTVALYGLTDAIYEQTVYPYGSPRLVELGDGRLMALWLKDDGTKSDNNRTTLYYSVYQDGAWTAAAPVCDSGVADYAPQVVADNGTVYVLWQRASEVFADDAAIDDVIGCTELVYASFADGGFSEPVTVVSGGMYQTDYAFAAENGTVLVSWLENSDNDYTGATGTNTVYSRTFADGAAAEIETLASYDSDIGGVACGFADGQPQVAYTAADTADSDYELYIDGVAVTADEVDDLAVSFQNGAFYWLKDTALYTYADGAGADTTVTCDDMDYQLLADGSVIFTVSDGFTNELYIAYPLSEGYTSPVALTDYGMHISQYDAALLDGEAVTITMIDHLSEDDEAFPYTTADLLCETRGGYTSLGVGEYLLYDEETVAIGETVTLTADIGNRGTNAIDSVTATLTNVSGEVLRTQEVALSLLPGDTAQVTVDYTIPEGFTKQELTLTLSVAGDIDMTDNTVSAILGNANVAVMDCVMTDGVLTGTVVNNGLDTAVDAAVDIAYFGETETVIDTLSVGDLAAGASETFTCTIPAEYMGFDNYYQVNKFVVSASTASEEQYYADNDAEICTEPVRVSGITLDTTETVLDIGEQDTLAATVQPLDAFEQGVVYISDSTDVATVDENGVVTALASGTATITAISADGDYTVSCTVTVVLLGDFDDDDTVTSTDVRLMMKELTKASPTFTDAQIMLVDMDGDSVITSADARLIIKRILDQE